MNCIVLDRDGTLIRHIPYLHDPKQVQLLPTVVEGLQRLVESGCTLFLHTNQSGIGRGFFSLDAALACNEEMLRQIGMGKKLFAEVCVCPEAPDHEIAYRKPSPRYGLELMARHAVTKERMCYVGDNLSDLLTAANVGCYGVGVDTGGHDLRTLLAEHSHGTGFPVFDTFVAAADHIVSRLRSNAAN